MKIACTGHRTERLRGNEEYVRRWLRDVVAILAAGRNVSLLCGGAEGTDEIFGGLKKMFPKAELVLYLPCKDYRKDALSALKEEVNQEFWIYNEWRKGADSKRDRMMVNDCDVLLAVWDGIENGGTWETIKYAKSKGKVIIYIPNGVFYEKN